MCIRDRSGTRLLMTYSNGIRQPLLKNKPITCLEDIKGLKMRTAETPPVSYTHLDGDSEGYYLSGSSGAEERFSVFVRWYIFSSHRGTAVSYTHLAES